jgi:hypothetical protein
MTNSRVNEESVPSYWLGTYKMLTTCFPESLPSDDYFPIIRVLSEWNSEGAVSDIMMMCGFGEHYVIVESDFIKVISGQVKVSDEELERTISKLMLHGYDAWLDEMRTSPL